MNGIGKAHQPPDAKALVRWCERATDGIRRRPLLDRFLSLRLRITLIKRMKKSPLAGKMWVPDVINLLKKLKMSCVRGNWRLNEVTKSQKELFK